MSAPSQTDEKKAPSRPGALASLSKSFRSWRTTAVTLQQFPSGLPLGCVLIAVPAWLATIGVDIKTIGFITLSQAPWTFKFLWSPLMDRYAPPFFGRRRGWAVLAQIALFLSTLGLALAATRPDHVAAIGLAATLIAFAAATQDIAIDAYAVEVLEREEQGVAAGARSAVSRFALTLAGRISIWASKYVSWPALFAVQSLFYIPAAVVSILAPAF